MDMKPACRITLAVGVMLLIAVYKDDLRGLTRRSARYQNSAAAASASPLSGSKIRQPWLSSWSSSSGVNPCCRYIPTLYDGVGDNQMQQQLTRLLDVGACTSRRTTTSHSNDHTSSATFSYVPPLDGTNPNNMLCHQNYGMRFVLFDLHLVNIDTVDTLSGSFTAQLQLVFHWREAWEMASAPEDGNWFAYIGDDIETADNASNCGFDCDSTSAAKRMCCDGLWVPPLQVPSCKINDVQSITPEPYLTKWYYLTYQSYWDP